MRLLRTLFVWMLAVTWLPATLHCAMEQAGVLELADSCCDNAEHRDVGKADTCEADPCAVLEAGWIKQAGDGLKAPPPALAVVLLLALPPLVEEAAPTSLTPATTDSPPELCSTWQFIERAALAPRAPGLTS